MSSVKVSLPYLRIGSGGPHVRAIQGHLQRHKLLSDGVDGIFGQQTEQAVRAFQRGQGIDADGIVGPDTWGALAETGLDLTSRGPVGPPGPQPQHPFIRMGSVGPHVGAIQAHLGLKNTAVFDVATEEEVRGFQRQASLTTDGIVGQKTWAALLSSGLDAHDLPPFGRDKALDMSDAVQLAYGRRSTEKLTAYDIVAELLKTHQEYADGRAGSFDVGAVPADTQRLLFMEWLARVRPLFDPRLVRQAHDADGRVGPRAARPSAALGRRWPDTTAGATWHRAKLILWGGTPNDRRSHASWTWPGVDWAAR